MSAPGSGDTRFGFTGEQVDGNGLVYLRARYYQPEMGRFLNADPSRVERNPYQYAMSNPVLFTDPSGLCGEACDTIANDLKTRYGVVLYWDGRNNTDDLIEWGVTSAWLSNGCSTVPAGCPSCRFEQVTVPDLQVIVAAFDYMSEVLGTARLRSMTQGGIIFFFYAESGDGWEQAGQFCPGGRCFGPPYNAFQGPIYAIGLTVSGGIAAETVAHEYGHRISHLTGAHRKLYEKFQPFGYPSGYAALELYEQTKADEYLAETFVSYVWDHSSAAWPPPIMWKPVTSLHDIRRTWSHWKPILVGLPTPLLPGTAYHLVWVKVTESQTLDEYFAQEVLPKIR